MPKIKREKYTCTCGETNEDMFYKYHPYRCKKCEIAYSVERRRENAKFIKNHLGGKCERCGYDNSLRALDVHHKDPNTKINWDNRKGWKRERIINALKDCVLLCANCHREEHDDWY